MRADNHGLVMDDCYIMHGMDWGWIIKVVEWRFTRNMMHEKRRALKELL